MKTESNLTIELWEVFKEYIPTSLKGDLALSMLRSLEEYGFDAKDLSDILDEDEHLTSAYRAIFGGDDEDEDGGLYDDYSYED